MSLSPGLGFPLIIRAIGRDLIISVDLNFDPPSLLILDARGFLGHQSNRGLLLLRAVGRPVALLIAREAAAFPQTGLLLFRAQEGGSMGSASCAGLGTPCLGGSRRVGRSGSCWCTGAATGA